MGCGSCVVKVVPGEGFKEGVEQHQDEAASGAGLGGGDLTGSEQQHRVAAVRQFRFRCNPGWQLAV